MSDLIKQIDEERYAYRLYGFDGSSTDLVLADCKAEIERLSKPISAVAMAEQFHEAYERLAPEYGYVTREETKIFNPDSPNGQLMIAVCSEVCRRAGLEVVK